MADVKAEFEVILNREVAEAAVKAFGLIRRLIAHDPGTPPVDGFCFWCKAYLADDQPHAEDCPYIEAKDFLELPKTS